MLELAVLVLWIFLGIALFGLGRLMVLKQGLAADWAELVRFGKSLPTFSSAWTDSPETLERILSTAPPGMFLPPVAEPDAAPPATSQILFERMRLYQAALQSEMKWFAHRVTNPFQWFLSGLRGVLLVPWGVALPTGAKGRARRRGLEHHADFERIVTAVLGVALFVLLVDLYILAREGLPELSRLLRN